MTVAKGQGLLACLMMRSWSSAFAQKGCSGYTRKQLDELTEFVKKKPQVGAKGMVYIRCEANGTFKSSVDKFFDEIELARLRTKIQCRSR